MVVYGGGTICLSNQDVVKEEAILLFSSSNPTPMETIFLSNIDQTVAFPVETIFFFQVPPHTSTANISQVVRKAMEDVVLGPYYFMAGRLKFNNEANRLELVCNNGGVSFVDASCSLALNDLPNLSLPNPTFHHLIHRPAPLFTTLPLAQTPIFTIQASPICSAHLIFSIYLTHATYLACMHIWIYMNMGEHCAGDKV